MKKFLKNHSIEKTKSFSNKLTISTRQFFNKLLDTYLSNYICINIVFPVYYLYLPNYQGFIAPMGTFESCLDKMTTTTSLLPEFKIPHH